MPGSPPRALARLRNVWRRVRGGLPARSGRGGPVTPEVPNDLFQAHAAFYHFAARYTADRRVLDLGCGSGYGAARLAAAGAAEVVGLDRDPRLIAYAGRRFSGPRVRFVTGDAAALPEALGRFGLAVAGNLLAHLERPGDALSAAARVLGPDGVFVASVPPLTSDRLMEAERAGGVHRAALYLWDWESLLRDRFTELRLYRLEAPSGARLDFADPRPSRLRAEDFQIEEVPLARLPALTGPTAIFVASRPRAAS